MYKAMLVGDCTKWHKTDCELYNAIDTGYVVVDMTCYDCMAGSECAVDITLFEHWLLLLFHGV